MWLFDLSGWDKNLGLDWLEFCAAVETRFELCLDAAKHTFHRQINQLIKRKQANNYSPHLRSTTSTAMPNFWQSSLIGSKTFSRRLFRSSVVSVNVELRKIRITFCLSLRSSFGPSTLKQDIKNKITRFLLYSYKLQCIGLLFPW